MIRATHTHEQAKQTLQMRTTCWIWVQNLDTAVFVELRLARLWINFCGRKICEQNIRKQQICGRYTKAVLRGKLRPQQTCR